MRRINWGWIMLRIAQRSCRHEWMAGDRTSRTDRQACAKCGVWRWFLLLPPRIRPANSDRGERPMRDIAAALLRSRGYTHDDEADPADLHWYSPNLGVRPILACIAYEFGDQGGGNAYVYTEPYSVQTPYLAPSFRPNESAD